METAFETINEQLSLGGESNMIWHERPADNWDEALPVGNGRIGGMIFGKPADELIQLNEDSLWSGSFRKRNNPKAYKNLEKMRRLIDEGHTMEAQALCEDAFYGTNEQQRHYQLLGDLHIWTDAADYTDYKRALSLETAVQRTEYTCGGVKYFREMFVSKPDEVMTIKYSCEEKGRVNITSVIDGRDDNYDKNEAYDDNTLLFTVSDGIPYGAAVMIFSEGGKAYTDANRLRAEGCDSVYIVLSCRSAFRSGDYVGEALRDVKKAARMGYDMLKKRHIADYSQLYSRSSVILPDNSEDRCFENTEKRLSYVREGKPDNKLTELYFNFSKYLMIAGSREGTLPLNLQGIWNKDMWPAWGGKYTVNINTEMNYWAAEPQGLGCCVEPLFDHIERMRENGRVTAREMYHCGGAVCHHNTDIWGDCAPQDKWLPATLWPMGLAWLCTHIWEHYKFTQDKTFLAEKFDTLKEACEFFADYLIDDGKGRMVTSPSVSPENTYVTKTGEHGTVCKGPSMDSQILYTLFTALIESAEILDKEVSISGEYAGRDPEFIEKIKRLRSLLPPIEVGKYGQIMEWSEDYDEVEPGHRHISQLFALHPADMITVKGTPELAAAARATIERRLSHGGGHTGWSRAWIINMWARLHDGAKVYENISALLSHSTSINMFDMHPPFQIDGNFGGGAGIQEAVFQSCSGELMFLPALPEQWASKGEAELYARGGFKVRFFWEDGRLDSALITSLSGGKCRICGNYKVTLCGEELTDTIVSAVFADGVTEFYTEAGYEYYIEQV